MSRMEKLFTLLKNCSRIYIDGTNGTYFTVYYDDMVQVDFWLTIDEMWTMIEEKSKTVEIYYKSHDTYERMNEEK